MVFDELHVLLQSAFELGDRAHKDLFLNKAKLNPQAISCTTRGRNQHLVTEQETQMVMDITGVNLKTCDYLSSSSSSLCYERPLL